MNNDINEQLMNLTEILITEEDDILLPAKKIYTLIKEEKGDDIPSFEAYKGLLQKESRFKLITIPLDDMSDSLWTEEYEQKLEEHGCYHGPYVTLEGDDISQISYIELLLEKLKQVIQVLQGLYEVKVETNTLDPDEEDRIQTLLFKAESIKEQLSLVKRDLEVSEGEG